MDENQRLSALSHLDQLYAEAGEKSVCLYSLRDGHPWPEQCGDRESFVRFLADVVIKEMIYRGSPSP